MSLLLYSQLDFDFESYTALVSLSWERRVPPKQGRPCTAALLAAMLLRQHFVRVNTPTLPCLTGTQARSAPCSIRRQHSAGRCDCAATLAEGQQTAQRPAAPAAAPTAEAGTGVLLGAKYLPRLASGAPNASQQHAADVAAEWSIPPQEWGSHATLLSG